MSLTVIDHAEAVLRACEIEPKPADRMLEGYLRRHRGLASRERRALYDIVFGVMRWRLRLDGMCLAAGVRAPTHRHRAVAYARWRGVDIIPADDMLGPLFDPHSIVERSFPGGMAAYLSYPDFLYERIVRERGLLEGTRIMREYSEPAATVLRVNTLKASRAELMDRLQREGIASVPTQYSPFGLILSTRAPLATSGAFRDGWFEVQDEASQLASLYTAVRPGDTVLDACAGGGGKSLAMAMLMENRGRIIATDRDARKLGNLRRRAERAGANCIEVRPMDQLKGQASRRGSCDVVVVDAPCSGTGTLRRNPDIKWRINESMISAYAAGQRALIEEYASWLKAGGRLIYLTCSILAEENEGVACAVHGRVSLARLSRSELPYLLAAMTAMIGDDGSFDTTRLCAASMDGFFGCAFCAGYNGVDNQGTVLHKSIF